MGKSLKPVWLSGWFVLKCSWWLVLKPWGVERLGLTGDEVTGPHTRHLRHRGPSALHLCLVPATWGWEYVLQQHHFSRDTCRIALIPAFKRWGGIVHLRRGNAWPWHPNKVRSTPSAALSCYLMLSRQEYSTVYPLFQIGKCKNIASEGQYSIPSRSAYRLVFFPIDSENQSPLPASICNL